MTTPAMDNALADADLVATTDSHVIARHENLPAVVALDAARQPAPDAPMGVAGIEFIGEATFRTGYHRFDTEVGGLSGITYDPVRGPYYTLSDDRSDARFYTVAIDLGDGVLDDGDVTFTGVTRLTDRAGTSFPDGVVDPEGIALTNRDTVFIASEGNARQLISPFVDEFSLGGGLLKELPVSDIYTPDAGQRSGIRNNLAFESATVSPDNAFVTTALENALIQDGPAADIDDGSPVRIRQWDAHSGEPLGEVVYTVDAPSEPPADPNGFATNGLVELLAIDNAGTFLTLERSFSEGVGNSIRLYQASTAAADDVIDVPSLAAAPVANEAEKELVLDLATLGIPLDNVEGMTWGPDLPDGRKTLVMVSDNNFNETQFTQFLAFAVDLSDTASDTYGPDTGSLGHTDEPLFGIGGEAPASGGGGTDDQSLNDGASLDVFPLG
jgi:3-phytase